MATANSGQAVPFGRSSSAVATDNTTGNLLFYTDGTRIFDASNQVMPNGNGILGDSTQNQSVSIVPVPGTDDQYFVLTVESSGDLRSTVVDMSLQGNGQFPPVGLPLGNVPAATKNQLIPGQSGLGEAMVVISADSADHYWIITQIAGTSQYQVMKLSPNVALGAEITTFDFSGAGAPTLNAGSFSFNEATNKLAVSGTETG